MVIDKNRILIGSLILLFFLLGYFIKLDLVILLSITILALIELYKSRFINNYIDYLILIVFLGIFSLAYFNNFTIYLLNIFLIIFVFIIINFPNFNSKRLFLICILIFIINFFSIFYEDRNLLYLTIFTAFFNDTIAYVSGRLLKGPLITPSISPNKTWSGTIISFFATYFLIYQFNFSIFLSALLSISLFFGDIFFSYIKRKNKLKDFSNILHNHGGILDRLDSMFFFTTILILT